MVNLERNFHMAEGEGEHSYAKNSTAQEKVMLQTTPIVENAIKEVYTTLAPKTMVIADLGCSSGPNTLLFISNVIGIIASQYNNSGDPVELQIFLNDLPGNDFNQLFRSLEDLKQGTMEQTGYTPPLCYISGLPKSYYNRLFPRQSVHLFHSSCCLHWLSQVPKELYARKGAFLNEDSIYITKTTSPFVVKCFQEQFHNDFSIFLKLRHEELVYGGKMVLVLCGRKDEEDVYNGYLNKLFGLVARSLQSLVANGIVEKERLEAFDLPLYGPSIADVREIVMESHMFKMDYIKFFEQNWDPYDDTEGDYVYDSARSGMNISKFVRAMLEPLIACHFGETILDLLFADYACRVSEHLEQEKTKCTLIVMSLKKI